MSTAWDETGEKLKLGVRFTRTKQGSSLSYQLGLNAQTWSCMVVKYSISLGWANTELVRGGWVCAYTFDLMVPAIALPGNTAEDLKSAIETHPVLRPIHDWKKTNDESRKVRL